MAVIDDEFLDTLLREAGASFEVPMSGAADILLRASGAESGPVAEQGTLDLGAPVSSSPRTLRGVVRSHRLLSVAASVILIGAIAGSAVLLGRGTSTPPRVSSGLAAGHSVPSTRAPASTGSGFALAPNTTSGQKSSNGTLNQGASTGGSADSAAPALAAPEASGTSTAAGGAATSTGGTATTPPLPAGSVGQSAKIEQTGSLNLTVAKGSLTNTLAKLTYLADANGGFVASSQTQKGADAGGPPNGTITLQVPVASFSDVLKSAQSLGKTSQLSTKATDVTGQYTDLQSQITALQVSRQQYLTIMTKATSIGDVLAVQAQLDTLQTQIQQLQGQLQVLSSETTYSTLTVVVSETSPKYHQTHPVARHKPSGLDKAWHSSVHGFTAGVDGLIRLAGPVLFALLCLAVLVFGGRLGWRRLQRHNL